MPQSRRDTPMDRQRRRLNTLMLAAVFALPAGALYAQAPSINLLPDDKQRTPEEEEKRKELDEKYQNAKQKVQAPQQAADPWGSMRGNDAPAAAKKKTSGAR
jgi:hypothetical protein